ncbi:MAG: phosphatidylglycerophosphatase A [Rubrimonas sp.]
MNAATLIATVAGIGRMPQAPGTWGSLAALPLAFLLHGLGGFPLFALATIALFALGIWATNAILPDPNELVHDEATDSWRPANADADPPEVVIDEVVGMLVTLWPLSLGLWMRGTDPWVFPWPGWVGGFLLFRFFDILKPPPIGRFERLPGAWGVMADDVAAGVLAALVVTAAAIVAHGFLM